MENKKDKPPLTYRLANTSWANWLMMHKNASLTFCACLVVVIIAGIWMMQARKTREIKDYETAGLLAEELQNSMEGNAADGQEKALAQLKSLVDNYPTLQPRFDSLLAQEYLLQNSKKTIDPYAKRTISRMRNLGLANFADFSEMSRLAGLKLYKEALKRGLELKKKVTDKEYTLRAFVLLHLASLNQLLGNQEAMLQSIFELKEFLGQTPRAAPLTSTQKEQADQFYALLQDGQTSLLEFMEQVPQTIK